MNDIKLTDQEKIVLDHLADAWNEFCKLDNKFDHDTTDFNSAIHSAQRMIAIRQARRAESEYWNSPQD